MPELEVAPPAPAADDEEEAEEEADALAPEELDEAEDVWAPPASSLPEVHAARLVTRSALRRRGDMGPGGYRGDGRASAGERSAGGSGGEGDAVASTPHASTRTVTAGPRGAPSGTAIVVARKSPRGGLNIRRSAPSMPVARFADRATFP